MHQSMSSLDLSNLKPRQVVAATLIVVAIALAFWLLYRFHHIIIIFFAALVLSTAIQPVTRRMHQFGLPHAVAVVLVYLLFLVALTGFFWLLAPLAFTQATRLAATLPDLYTTSREGMLANSSFFIWRLALVLPDQLPVVGLASFENGDVTTAIKQGMEVSGLFLKTLFAIAAVLVLTFYWTLDGQRTIRSLLLWLPLPRRQGARDFISEAENRVGAFVVGQLLLSTSIGVMALAVYLLLDLPYAFGLAIVAGVMELIPFLGPVLGALPAVIVAYSVDPTMAIWVVVATIFIQQLENNLLVPRIMKRSVGVNPLVTMLAILAFGLLFGVAGALVAIPMAAILQLVFERFYTANQDAPVGRDQVSLLRYEVQDLVQDIRKRIRHKEDSASAESDRLEDILETIAADLDNVLTAARQEAGSSAAAGKQEGA
jgi:predicted PurR-regulated permease PerM